MALIIPRQYKLKLLPETTEEAIRKIKLSFQHKLSKRLRLRRVTAPLFVLSGTGINDDLNGVESPVSFNIKCMGEKAEVVHSLAKWKRIKLGAYGIPPGYGIYKLLRFEYFKPLSNEQADRYDYQLWCSCAWMHCTQIL